MGGLEGEGKLARGRKKEEERKKKNLMSLKTLATSHFQFGGTVGCQKEIKVVIEGGGVQINCGEGAANEEEIQKQSRNKTRSEVRGLQNPQLHLVLKILNILQDNHLLELRIEEGVIEVALDWHPLPRQRPEPVHRTKGSPQLVVEPLVLHEDNHVPRRRGR